MVSGLPQLGFSFFTILLHYSAELKYAADSLSRVTATIPPTDTVGSLIPLTCKLKLLWKPGSVTHNTASVCMNLASRGT